MATGAELGYKVNAAALTLANTVFGAGVTVPGASYTGATNASAVYGNGNLSPGVVPSTSGVTTINGTSQPNLLENNTNDAFDTEIYGFTATLSLTMTVVPGGVNPIRIRIADTVADTVADTADASYDSSSGGDRLTITYITGIAVVAGQTITLASGRQITLNADGTFTVVGHGTVENRSFTDAVSDRQRHSDIGNVTISPIPCCVAGPRILTPSGEVAGDDLVNHRCVTPRPGGEVDYVQLLPDRHQVVSSEGWATERFLPGPQTSHSFERAIVDEIGAIFPGINPESGRGHSTAARRGLRGFEAQVLFALAQAA